MRKNVYISERMIAKVKELSTKYKISESRIIEIAFWLAVRGCDGTRLEEYLKRETGYRAQSDKREEEDVLRRIFYDYDDPLITRRFWRTRF